jgi:hypothetical protein
LAAPYLLNSNAEKNNQKRAGKTEAKTESLPDKTPPGRLGGEEVRRL